MNKWIIILIIAIALVILLLAWLLGWFGGSSDASFRILPQDTFETMLDNLTSRIYNR